MFVASIDRTACPTMPEMLYNPLAFSNRCIQHPVCRLATSRYSAYSIYSSTHRSPRFTSRVKGRCPLGHARGLCSLFPREKVSQRVRWRLFRRVDSRDLMDLTVPVTSEFATFATQLLTCSLTHYSLSLNAAPLIGHSPFAPVTAWANMCT